MRTSRAFTLIELTVTMGILILLAGIVFAALGPVRERSRETVCTSNLHQIGRAFSMYAADYDGLDPTVGVRAYYYQLGLPSDEDFGYLIKTYIKNRDVLFCTSYHGAKTADRLTTTYTGYSVDSEVWSQRVEARGPDVPFWSCVWHNPTPNPNEDLRHAPRWDIFRINILRLGGSVKMVKVHGQDSNPWDW
jgi:type II secretory pathway pseudopilin PulG